VESFKEGYQMLKRIFIKNYQKQFKDIVICQNLNLIAASMHL